MVIRCMKTASTGKCTEVCMHGLRRDTYMEASQPVMRTRCKRTGSAGKCTDIHLAQDEIALGLFTPLNMAHNYYRVGQNHIYIRCIHGIFGREITKYTVNYGVYTRFWPALLFTCMVHASGLKCTCTLYHSFFDHACAEKLEAPPA
jgi:hypothetical protein